MMITSASEGVLRISFKVNRLSFPVVFRHSGQLQHTVRQSGLAVVDVGNNAKVADVLAGHQVSSKLLPDLADLAVFFIYAGHAAGKAAHDLVVDGLCLGGNRVSRVAAVRAKDRDLVAHLHAGNVRHIDHCLVHADAPDHGDPLARG